MLKSRNPVTNPSVKAAVPKKQLKQGGLGGVWLKPATSCSSTALPWMRWSIELKSRPNLRGEVRTCAMNEPKNMGSFPLLMESSSNSNFRHRSITGSSSVATNDAENVFLANSYKR